MQQRHGHLRPVHPRQPVQTVQTHHVHGFGHRLYGFDIVHEQQARDVMLRICGAPSRHFLAPRSARIISSRPFAFMSGSGGAHVRMESDCASVRSAQIVVGAKPTWEPRVFQCLGNHRNEAGVPGAKQIDVAGHDGFGVIRFDEGKVKLL